MTAIVPPATARETVDPRAFPPVGLPPRTTALLTAVAQDGEHVREARSGRRATPYWSILFAVVAGDGAGLHAELRIWHASRNREYVEGRVRSLLGTPAEEPLDLAAPGLRLAVAQALATRSYRGSIATATDGRLEVAWLDAAVARAVPDLLPAPPAVRRVPPPPEPIRPTPELARVAFRHVTDAAGARAAAEELAGVETLALDIETDCGPLGSPRDWRPSDGAIRLVQVAGRTPGGMVCAVVDCYRVRADPLLRLLRDPERTIVAHNIRYEQSWLTFHHGFPPFRRPLDTSCGFRILDRHWAILDAAYEPTDSRLETVMRRVLALQKDPFGTAWWGAEPLPDPQLRYAALDAASLLPIGETVGDLADALGCTEQIAAASRAACEEGARRPTPTRAAVLHGAERLLDDAATPAALDDAARVLAALALRDDARLALRARYRERRAAIAG